MFSNQKAVLLVDAKSPPPDYRVESGTVGIGVLWTAIATLTVVSVWFGGILWWVANIKSTVNENKKKLDDLPNREASLLKQIDEKLENWGKRIEGSVTLLGAVIQKDIEHLQNDVTESRDSRSVTMSNFKKQLDRQGQENTKQQMELQKLEGVVQAVAGIQGQGNVISSPGYYQQPPSGRHNIQQ